MVKKSQGAFEFIILVGFVLLSFTVLFLVINENISDKSEERRNKAIKEFVLGVANEIDLASESTDGYYREFEIPSRIEGLEYEINLTEDMISFKSTNGKYAMAVPIQNASGFLVIGTNLIKNEKGEIKINVQI